METLIFIFNYCTDFLINLSNLFHSSYYEINALIFCIVWPLVTVILFILYCFQLFKLKKVRQKKIKTHQQ